jgi:hypothetical protein
MKNLFPTFCLGIATLFGSTSVDARDSFDICWDNPRKCTHSDLCTLAINEDQKHWDFEMPGHVKEAKSRGLYLVKTTPFYSEKLKKI